MKTKKIGSKLAKQTSHECILFKNNSVAAIGLRARFYYEDATVNGKNYIGSIFMINDYFSVSFARNINSTKRTTICIMSAIEKALN